MLLSDAHKTLLIIGIQAIGLLILDIATPLGIAVWVMYLIPLGLTTWLPQRQAPFIAASIFSLFLLSGFVFSPPGIGTSITLLNHGFAILTLWVTAFLIYKHKQRTAAELKTEVNKRLDVEEQLRISQQALAFEKQLSQPGDRLKARRLQDYQLIQRSRDLEAANRVSEAVMKQLPGDELLEQTLRLAVAAVNAEAGSILLLDPRTRKLVFRTVLGPRAEALVGKELPLDHGIAGAVLVSGEPEIIADATRDSRHDPSLGLRIGIQTRNMIVQPLRLLGDEAIGVLEVLNKRDGHFSHHDVAHLTMVSTLLSATLEQARLYREQFVKAEQVTTRP
jgi:putative methionine-R-sulfoxide reductase with GAF domain